MIINIMAGGPEALLPNLYDYNGENVIWAGVDRGVHTLLKANINPNIAFGDFDSVTVEEFTEIQKKVHELKLFKPEKDETDLELAINWAVGQNPETIRIFGATGGRMDHLLANIQLLVNPLMEGKSTKIVLIDRQNIIYIEGPGSHKIEKLSDKKYISFVPVSFNIKGLTLLGFKYPLYNRHISIGSTLCISNELISDYGTFSFYEGILLVIRSDD